MSTLLYSRVNCGLRAVVDILDIINDTFEGVLQTIPCYNTIENWVKKCGLKAYTASGKILSDKKYAQITDESMMIGSEKLLMTVGVPAEHQGHPLELSDVQILDIAIAESWDGEHIGQRLRNAAQKTGHSPQYAICDNAWVMLKGVRCAAMKHHCDISHSLGMFLERTYKKESDFQSYRKCMTEVKFKHNMKKTAYLLPPTQRTIARFINLSDWVEWSRKMSEIFHTLNADERKVFSFIPANASLIDELSEVMECINNIEHICKHQGLSQATVLQCQKLIARTLLRGNLRMSTLGENIGKFLSKEAKVLESDQVVHNNSSDILESIFGTLKRRKSPNKLYGVTSFILFIPIHARLKQKQHAQTFDFKATLEEIRLRQIEEWASQNLSPNLVNMRNKCFKNAG